MKKNRYKIAIIAFSIVITSCGSEESDEIKSGKINACKLKCVTEKFEKDQSNVDLYDAPQSYQCVNRLRSTPLHLF